MAFEYKNNPLDAGTYRVTSNFGYRTPPKTSTGYGTAQHKGIDLGTSGRSVPIYSVSDGVVRTVAYDHDGYGHYIIIDHSDGVETRYAHMASSSNLQEGQRVTAGTQIGNVGTTGSSSGLHLHFEIRVKGNPIDPAPYISSGGTTILSPSYDATIDVEPPSEVDSYPPAITMDAGGSVIGQRVSDVTEQPIFAYVNIRIGDDKIILSTEPARPNIIQSFEFTRLDGAGETAIFTLFDNGDDNLPTYGANGDSWDWVELEEILAKYYNNIYIEYGYYGTGKKSQLYKHLLLNYNISFVSTGVILSIESISEGAVQNLTQQSLTLNTYNPTEAAKMICESLGYKVLPENFDPSDDIVSATPFNMVEDYPVTYIQEVLIPLASKEGQELFSFDLEYDPINDETIAYFKREGYGQANQVQDMKTYIYQRGYDSSVIDFTVDIKGVFGGNGTFQVATEYRSSVFDTKTKDPVDYKVSKSDVVTAATGESTHTRTEQSNPLVDSAGYSPDQMKSKLYYHMKSMQYDSYEATLTIVGDPTIKLHEFIRIINVTERGYYHHTSGVYWVEGITDSIQGGSMTTTLKLIKNATAGDLDGLEIINPKIPVK